MQKRVKGFYIVLTLLYPAMVAAQGANRDPNRDYRKHWFWGIAFAGTQAKNKLVLSDYFYNQPTDSVKSLKASSQAGGAFGGSISFRAGRHWDFKTYAMLHLHQRNIEYSFFNRPNQSIKLETVSMDFPFNIKYRSTMPHNTRMYVLGGARYSYDFNSNQGVAVGTTRPLVSLTKNTWYYEFGTGFEFRLQYVDVGIELKMTNALSNALVRGLSNNVDPNNIYNRCLQGMYPRLFSITLFAYN